MDLTGPKNHDLAGLKNATIAQHLPGTNIINTENFSAFISSIFVSFYLIYFLSLRDSSYSFMALKGTSQFH